MARIKSLAWKAVQLQHYANGERRIREACRRGRDELIVTILGIRVVPMDDEFFWTIESFVMGYTNEDFLNKVYRITTNPPTL